MLGSTPSVAALFVTLHDSYSLQFRVALLPTRTLSCTYVLDCNRGTNKLPDDDDDDDEHCRPVCSVCSDIRSESRFLPTPPAFDVPVKGGGSRRNIAIPFGMEKLEWLGYPMVKKFRRYLYSF